MLIEPPHYHEFYPRMSSMKWKSNATMDLGWISGLHTVANNSLQTIYGTYDALQINPEDPFNFTELDFQHFVKDSHGPIIYLSFWSVILLLFIIAGFYWCIKHWCCCLCVKGSNSNKYEKLTEKEAKIKDEKEAKIKDEKDSGELKKNLISVVSVVLALLIAAWLILFFIIVSYTVAANNQIQEAVKNIDRDLNNTIRDIDQYLEVTRRQLRYTFETCFWTLQDKVDFVLTQCTGTGCWLVELKLMEIVHKALDKSGEYIEQHSKEIDTALSAIQETIMHAEKEFRKEFEHILVDVNKGLHAFFTIFNILYFAVITLVLTGIVFATLGVPNGLTKWATRLLRCSILLMFLLGVCAVIQLAILFVTAGVTSKVVCPAIRALENASMNISEVSQVREKRFVPSTEVNPYQVPPYGLILRACKNNESAYSAFNLRKVYDVSNINKIVDSYFIFDLPGMIANVAQKNPLLSIPIPLVHQVVNKFQTSNLKLPKKRKRSGKHPKVQNKSSNATIIKLGILETADEIKEQVNAYLHFVAESIEKDLGKCRPAYDAINATLSLFCDKTVAPVASFWWILQFVPPTFILIIVHIVILEKVNS